MQIRCNCWNNDKCRCKCKELIDKGVCDKAFIQNPSNCECECDKSCNISEYLDSKNCKCKKRLVDKLIDKCNGGIDEVKLTKITHPKYENENSYKGNSCTVYIVLFSIFFLINVGIDTYIFYYKYTNRNKRNVYKYYDFVYHV